MKKPKIIYEDEYVLVLDKPSGLLVHPVKSREASLSETEFNRVNSDGRSNEYNLCDWILEKYPEIEGVGESLVLDNGEEIKRPGIVHRLDKDTSGVIAVAKTQESFYFLKKQFQERRVEKIYNTFVYGEIKNKDGIIDRPIGRSSKDFRMKSAQRGAKGKLREAVTEYNVLKSNKDFSYLEVYPKTGRTHQIRVHLKAINYPVVCDSVYAPKKQPALGFKRLALHSRSIKFTNPDGKVLKIESELPEDFQNAVEKLA